MRAAVPQGTRPTSDKLKEALFSILETQLARSAESELECVWDGVRVLDLYAGVGSLGIEALSRGAAHCCFVDRSEAACRAIRHNLDALGLSDKACVLRREVERLLEAWLKADSTERYDIITLDPPYAASAPVNAVIERLQSERLADNGLLVVEHASRIQLAESVGRLASLKRRTHGDSTLTFYGRPAVVDHNGSNYER